MEWVRRCASNAGRHGGAAGRRLQIYVCTLPKLLVKKRMCNLTPEEAEAEAGAAGAAAPRRATSGDMVTATQYVKTNEGQHTARQDKWCKTAKINTAGATTRSEANTSNMIKTNQDKLVTQTHERIKAHQKTQDTPLPSPQDL